MSFLYCIRCDASWGRCGHSAGFYEDERFARLMQFEVVETTTGDVIRLMALGALTRRYASLLARSKEFSFSEIEIQHMESLARAIERLQGMAPVSALLPPRGDVAEELVPALT